MLGPVELEHYFLTSAISKLISVSISEFDFNFCRILGLNTLECLQIKFKKKSNEFYVLSKWRIQIQCQPNIYLWVKIHTITPVCSHNRATLTYDANAIGSMYLVYCSRRKVTLQYLFDFEIVCIIQVEFFNFLAKLNLKPRTQCNLALLFSKYEIML